MCDERGGRPVARMPDPSVSKSGRDPAELSLYEEERWLLQMGLSHGELRDEIYCQVTKQLISNPSPCVSVLFPILARMTDRHL